MTLYFVTGSEKKLEEARAILSGVKQIKEDLPEIQELDPKPIIQSKLEEACKIYGGKFFCEDTSLYIHCLNGFPGPLIKWFLRSLGNQGIAELVSHYEDKGVTAKTVIGYTDGTEIRFFEGSVEGRICYPKVESDFGWDPIFVPNGYDKSFAEMSPEEKNKISMRKQALEKLREYLDSK